MLPWYLPTFTKNPAEETFSQALILSIVVRGEVAYVTSRLKCAFAVSASNQGVKGAQLEICVYEAAGDEWHTPGGLSGTLLLDQINPLY